MAVATRCHALRHDVDRLDDSLHVLDPSPSRAEAAMHAVILRDQVDQLEALAEAQAAAG